MKFKIFLLLLVALGLGLYFERSRAVILDWAAPVLQPVFRWQTNGEMETLARDMISQGRTMRTMPLNQSDFQGWVRREYLGEDSGTDSWGTWYELQVRQDSFFIVSAGRDTQFGTPDDLRLARERPYQTR